MQDPIMFSLVQEDNSTKLRSLGTSPYSQTRFNDTRYPIEGMYGNSMC
jgi:hypothetical protein